MSRDYFASKIAVVQAQIDAYEAALTVLAAANGVQQYSLDTGQTRQSVTRADIPALNKTLDSLYDRLATFEARVKGASVTVRPCW